MQVLQELLNIAYIIAIVITVGCIVCVAVKLLRLERKTGNAFCEECKFLKHFCQMNRNGYECWHTKNVRKHSPVPWLTRNRECRSRYKPVVINRKNRCKWFKEKQR